MYNFLSIDTFNADGVDRMKIDVTQKTSRFATRALSNFSNKMMELLMTLPLEGITVQQLCDTCNYPRSTFYNYFEDIFDLMDYCWLVIMHDIRISEGENTQEIFTILYEYFDGYREQIHRISSRNALNGMCMNSLRAFLKKQIKEVLNKCANIRNCSIRQDIMVDYYALTIEMLLEKSFLDKNPLSKEEALSAVRFLLGTIEKEIHTK